MGRKAAKEQKSDDIEIISIGKLYTGPWDKKYWSASRGKDRYPYPIGFKSLRIQNGVTYTMEIFEGLKGPAFMISSIDGKASSGDTPDIAWESFQKKCFSKLWNGKRSSFKIDGVEFFGFRNTFVQRLLRELVANVGQTAEEGLSLSNFGSGVSETVNHLLCKPSIPNTNFLSCLVKSRVKGKRSKIKKTVNRKCLNGSNFKQQQEKPIDGTSSSYPKQSHQCGRDPSTSTATEEASGNCSPAVCRPQNSAVLIEDEKCSIAPERGKQMDFVGIPDDLRVGDSLSQGEKCLTSSADHFGFNIGDLLLDQEPVEGLSNIMPEKRDGATNVQRDLSTGHDADLCIPDTLDSAEGRHTLYSPKNDLQMHGIENDAIVKDVTKHEMLATDLCPGNGICSSANCTSSENSHIDSVGQEIAKSMMSVLLPQAVPLLKTFTRKKKKTGNLVTHRLPEENITPEISMKGSTTDTGTAGVKIVAPADVSPAPIKEITPNPKRARVDCQSLEKVPPAHASTMHGTSTSETITCRKTSDISMPEKSEARFAKLCKSADFCGRDTSSAKSETPSTSGCNSLPENNENNDYAGANTRQSMKLPSNLQGRLELFAHYVHPKPVSLVHLIVKENEVFVCVICGYPEHNEKSLFLYNASMNREKIGCPSLVGHAAIAFQISENNFGKDSALYGSSLQLTPDAQSLVLLNSIKTPYCREGKLHCSCPACTSDCSGKNAVKILQLKKGYASLVTRLQTSKGVSCLLVCGCTFLLAGEEGGKLKLWVMNFTWSAQEEDCHLPTFDCMFPSIVELKTIPNSDSLVIGHNGQGQFGLWDIKGRNLVSKFSSPGMSISGLVPVCAFRWKRKGEYQAKALLAEIMDATKNSFSKRIENHTFLSECKDAVVWLLISAPSSRDSQSYQSSKQEANLGECWRLALLVSNTVITGSDLDQGAASVTPMGHGIMGTRDGLVYIWELSTGLKLANVHSFKGRRVSHITTDASKFGALAVASEGELLVYLPS